jgi:DNA-binding transcriptional regulator YhcF (GntR family)
MEMIKPKYVKIKEIIKEEIEGRRINILSEREIIHRFNVSSITARRVLNELEDEGYIERKVGKGSIVIERELNDIGIIFYSFKEPGSFFIHQVIEGIEEKAEKNNYHLHLYTTRKKSITETKNTLYHLLNKNKFKGLIILSPLPENDIKFLKENKIPFVVIANYYPGIDCSYVIYDYKGVTREICERLYKKGARKIGIVISEKGEYGAKRSGDLIYDGYREFLNRKDIKEEIVIETKDGVNINEILENIRKVDFMIIGDMKVSDMIIDKGINGNFVLYTYKEGYGRCVFFSFKEYGRIGFDVIDRIMKGEKENIKIKLKPEMKGGELI